MVLQFSTPTKTCSTSLLQAEAEKVKIMAWDKKNLLKMAMR